MTNELNITLKDSLKSDEAFFEFLKQDARSGEYRKLKELTESGTHPTDEMLYHYVLGWSDEKLSDIIRNHMLFCGICTDKILRFMKIEDELEEDLLEWADTPEEIPMAENAKAKHLGSLLKDSLISRISELWIPQWAGQLDLVSAADIPAQEHPFKTEDGEVRVRCYWKQKRGNKPAFIHVSWTVNITAYREIKLFFVNPETDPPEIRCEASLGTIRIGEKTFAGNELGFDPSAERWGIAVAQIQ